MELINVIITVGSIVVTSAVHIMVNRTDIAWIKEKLKQQDSDIRELYRLKRE